MDKITIVKEIVINRPIQEVFETATCMESCINWWTMIKEAKKVSEGPTAVGTEYRHIAKFMGVSVESRPVVTLLEPPYRFAYQSRTPTAHMDVTFMFEEVSGGTKMTIQMEADPIPNMFAQTLLPMVMNAAGRQFQSDMDTLKAMMENDVKVKVW